MTLRVPVIFNPTTQRLEELGVNDTIAGTEIEGLMGRNRFINGDMRIWQRGVSFNASGGTSKLFCSDRWFVERNTSTIVAARQDTSSSDRASVGPVPNYMRATVAASAGTGHYALLGQDVEDVLSFSGQTLVVSGWFRAQSTMKLNLEAIQITNGGGGNPSFKTASQQVTSTWQYLSFVLPIAALTIAIGSGSRLRLRFWLSGGTDWASSTDVGTQNGWFDFTQLQVEQGVIASPFERRFDAIEMLMCQRYWEKSYDIGVFPGAVSSFGRRGEFIGITPRTAGNSFLQSFTVAKRATPSITIYASETGAANNVSQDDGSNTAVSTLSAIGQSGFQLTYTNAVGRYGASFHYVADAEF